ncbi:hypothetical protein CK503_05435 [Aliifodinibius salipaludis]|uniref:Lipoprotein n=1 Tax=Fodinibius salipaludis TaxID=2032627 RepID=A0A2A2GDS0_9BACT|nr:hypothetical protein [Aliifodinibius salipaludis]PAU94912.1 hypothetical protein CK503_05435 [Aliifodinibius salipaludis]
MSSKEKYLFHLFITGFLAIAFISCDLSNDDSFQETYSYSFQNNKALAIDTTHRDFGADSTMNLLNVSTIVGNNRVFRYHKNITAPRNIADGGYSETVHFQIPREVDRFKFKNSELSQAKIYFQRSCFCPQIGALKVEYGVIEGQKLSENLWSVSASLQPKGPNETYDIKFEGAFILN